jgi:YidC/Oxa1 family membrane protein insertase
MDDQNRNLILATALSMVVILVWFVLFPPPEVPEDPNARRQTAQPAETGEGEKSR